MDEFNGFILLRDFDVLKKAFLCSVSGNLHKENSRHNWQVSICTARQLSYIFTMNQS
jgi:hypothetical protein